ncbi:uncharacterized protein LOC118281453 [Spodoptera frugiperda]|uniref:Uncharacterized protein LOC118281373 n=1 Tax=Spodoptera frugiperda TaxID=7108 RepID=A0A9R0EEE7_SPOFR|nr:uncharacterized protein LOC118281373 [Spodoptera frugiperda]XP_050563571.1 uncharacterized protein LOC118281453 [Spodoptera frugiperda]
MKSTDKTTPPDEERAGELSSPAVIVFESPSGSGAHGESPIRAPNRRTSDSESDAPPVSDASVRSKRLTRASFKRPRLEEDQEGLALSSITQETPAPKISTAARGKGKGKGCKRSAATARTETANRLSDSSIVDVTCVEGSEAEHDPIGLRQTIKEELRRVAAKKSQPARNEQMKSAETTIMTAVFKRCGVPSAEKVHSELAIMRQELARLSASNAALEAELQATKAELAASRGSRPQPMSESDMLGLMRREMAAFRQRFDVLESKVLRPPLAASQTASRSYAAVAAKPSTSSGQTGRGTQPPARARAAPPARAPVPPLVSVEPPPNAPIGRRNKRRGGVTAQQAVGPVTVMPVPPARDLSGGEWQLVGDARRVAKEGRKRRKKAQRQRRQQQRKEKGKGRPSATPVVSTAAAAAAAAVATTTAAVATAGCNAAREEVVMDCQ